MKRTGKIMLGLCLLSALALGACGKKEDGGAAASSKEEYKPYGKYEEPVTFTIGRSNRDMSYMTEGDTISDNPATRFLIEETNIHPEVAWESADFAQKLALSISTGDIPDVMVVGESQYKELLDNGLLADLTEAYDKSASDNMKERIESYDEDVLKIASDDEGKLRAIPMPYYYYEHTLTWIRKDWLEQVGGEIPETIDDLHDLGKKFVDAKLGGDETYAFTLNENVMGDFGSDNEATPIVNQLGAFPRQWIEKDGKAVYGSIQPEVKEGLQLLQDWYKEGLIDKQFAVRKDDERIGVLTNSVGIHFAPWWSPQFEMLETIKAHPESDWIAIAGPKEDGKFQTFKGNPMLRYVVVSKDYKHPEAIVRALNSVTDFNFSLTDEAVAFREKEFGTDTYFPWYYAPIDYKLENSQANKNDYLALEEATEKNDESLVPQHLKGSYDLIEQYEKEGTANTKAWAERTIFLEGIKAAVDEASVYNDMSFFGKTKTMETKWANLQKLENETFVKIVMGEEDISAFDKFVEDWKSQGGDEITKEVNEETK